MVMVPDDWKAFIANTMAQVESGAIPLARIDDAVSRIVRVKLRAGLFEHRPSQSRYALHAQAILYLSLPPPAFPPSLLLLSHFSPPFPSLCYISVPSFHHVF